MNSRNELADALEYLVSAYYTMQMDSSSQNVNDFLNSKEKILDAFFEPTADKPGIRVVRGLCIESGPDLEIVTRVVYLVDAKSDQAAFDAVREKLTDDGYAGEKFTLDVRFFEYGDLAGSLQIYESVEVL